MAENGNGAGLHTDKQNKRHPYGHDSPQRCLDDTWSFCKCQDSKVRGCKGTQQCPEEWKVCAQDREEPTTVQQISKKCDRNRHEKGPRRTSCPPQSHKSKSIFYCIFLLETGHLSTSVPSGKRGLSRAIDDLSLCADATISIPCITTLTTIFHYKLHYL